MIVTFDFLMLILTIYFIKKFKVMKKLKYILKLLYIINHIEFCYGVYNQYESFIYLVLMVKNMEVHIERYFKWCMSTKLAWVRYQNY
jgi:hypothetical protein